MLLSALLSCGHVPATEVPRVLVFTKTAGWRHDSLPSAIAALQRLGEKEGIAVDATEDAGAFNSANLARYRAVIFASTTGDVLDDAQQAAMETFVRNGGGFMGIHAAADTEYDWRWYGELVGAWFKSHPPGLQTTQVVFEYTPPSASQAWTVTDEIYNYRDNPRARVQVLATVQESNYEGGTMGEDHPIAWCHAFDGGRAWYTGLGHEARMYEDPTLLWQLTQGLRYAAGVSETC